MTISKDKINEMIEQWMVAWKSDDLGPDYARAREFRDFWIDKVSELGLEDAWISFNSLNPSAGSGSTDTKMTEFYVNGKLIDNNNK